MKDIVLNRDGAFSVSGGQLVAGDTGAYRLKIDMGEPTEGFTAMAVCQENGQYSAAYETSGNTVSCALLNSMYSEPGFITVRLAVSKGSAVLTVKEVAFEVKAANNDSELAETESGSISNILTAVSEMREAAEGLAEKAATLAGYGITDAYTKAEVDQKVGSTFKYKGTFISPMVIPKTGFNAGDVYNCAWGNYVPQQWLDSKEIASITETRMTGGISKFTLTFAEDFGSAFDYAQYIGIQLEGCPGGAIVGYIDNSPHPTGKKLEVIMDTNKFDYCDAKGISNPYMELGIFIEGHTGSYQTAVLNIWWGETYGRTQYVGDEGDVVYTGSAWDSLGSDFNSAQYFTKAQTNSQIDSKINAAITKTLNTEV